MKRIALAMMTLFVSACFNPLARVDGRTALEQQLTRTAIHRAIEELPLHRSVLDGQWKIEVVSPAALDDGWTRALLRRRLIETGAKVSSDPDAKLPVVEALVTFAGSDIDNFVVGVPLPGTLGAGSVSFYHENVQRGRARIQLSFWDGEGNLIAETPSTPGTAQYGDMFFLTFIGPFSFTDLGGVGTSRRLIRRGTETWNSLQQELPAGTDASASEGTWILPDGTATP